MGLNQGTEESRGRPSVMINGAHHSRELTSIQMVCYMMLKLTFEYQEDSDKNLGLLSAFFQSHIIYFIPVVNIDGFAEIDSQYHATGELELIRKNMRVGGSRGGGAGCKEEDRGVDLNRNYDFAFAHDNIGSSSDPCDEQYRGKHAFSEPATRQLKNFIEETPEGQSVKIALNLHAYGNLLIHPWNYINHKFPAMKYKS